MKNIRKIIEYLTILLVIFLLLSLIASVVVAKFYGNELKEHAKELINDNINNEFSVDKIGIHVLRNFPNISLYFSDVIIWSGTSYNRDEFDYVSRDILLISERIYIKFNLFHLLWKKISVSNLEIRNGQIKLLIDQSGQSNFIVPGNKQKQERSRLVELKGVNFNNIQFQYINNAKEMVAGGTIRELFMEGDFFNNKFSLKSGGTVYIDKITNHGVAYLNKQEIHSDVDIRIENNKYFISKGALELGDLTAGITGNFVLDTTRKTEIDLQFAAKKIDIEWISRILSNSNRFPEGIRGKGKFDLSVNVTGKISSTISPHIDAIFSADNISLELQKTGLKFRSITLDGDYSNGALKNAASSVIHIHAIRGNTDQSDFSGSIKVQDFISPLYEISLVGAIKASELTSLISGQPVIAGEGILKPKLIFKGTAQREKGKIKKITFNPIGEIEIENLDLAFTGMKAEFNSLNGTINILQNKWRADLMGYLNQTDFRTNLSATDLLNAFQGRSVTEITGSIYSNNLNIGQLSRGWLNEEIEDKKRIYPEKISANIDFHFDTVIKGPVRTGKVKGNLVYKYPKLYIDPLKLETMEGVMNSRIALNDLHKPVHQLSINSIYDNVDITEVFKSFNNFGQEFLTHQNIKGTISGDSEFFTTLNNSFSINPSKIISENRIVIENGELINFQPLIKLSNFLNIDQMDHIFFSKLQNTIVINHSTITIPQMDINSSALNLQASGIHRFNREYRYHIATKLSELLFKKARSMPDAEFDIALDKNDRRTIFLVLYDDGMGMTIEFDEDQAMRKIKQDLADEKTELKKLLNREFGMFDKDESLQQKTEPADRPIFEFDFSPVDSTVSENEKKPSKSKWRRKEKPENKKPALDFVIEDDDL